MTGILIVTHGNLGESLLKTAEMIMGEQENISALSLPYDKDIQELQNEIGKSIEELDQGDGVVVFTDLYGGSPNTAVTINLKKKLFYALCGVNLPMLIECISSREFMPVTELVAAVKEAGVSGIKDINELMQIAH